MAITRAQIAEENLRQVKRQRDFRVAADIVTDAFMNFPEVAAIAVIGAVARPLWKEIPRFSTFRRHRIEIWHECFDVDLAVWIGDQRRLGQMRRARDKALRAAYEAGTNPGVVGHQVDVHLFEPRSNFYTGRLCDFSECPHGKPVCRVPGCGAIPFRQQFADFKPDDGLLETVGTTMLYEREHGRLRSALDLPQTEDAPGG